MLVRSVISLARRGIRSGIEMIVLNWTRAWIVLDS